MATRIGVDIGGTYTDLISYDDQGGRVHLAKVLSTTESLDEGVVEAVSQAVPEELIQAAEYFLHGTTVGLNSLLERRGEVVGLLTTKGFRDILEIRRGDRDEMYDSFWKPPPPLVPRWLRLPVSERIRTDGHVLAPLAAGNLRDAVKTFSKEGVTSVAVAFINSYANPAHELEVEQVLRNAGFVGEVSLSHRVSGEYREYERTTTTVIDAFVRGRTTRYLRRLGSRLTELGLQGNLLVTRSEGGSMTFAEAEDRPFETIMSGPVAGVEGAAELSRNAGIDALITADVGGTSFDIAVVLNGRAQLMYEGKIVGLPVQTPWVDVRSIGAGGGSIAYVDAGGLLRVGPQSAGAQPGPAGVVRARRRRAYRDGRCPLARHVRPRALGGWHPPRSPIGGGRLRSNGTANGFAGNGNGPRGDENCGSGHVRFHAGNYDRSGSRPAPHEALRFRRRRASHPHIAGSRNGRVRNPGARARRKLLGLGPLGRRCHADDVAYEDPAALR